MVGCNGLAGIATTANAINGRNRIMPFVVGLDGGLPIDRHYDGRTPINYPSIASISLNGSNVTIAGTACANCDVSIYAARGNSAAPGGGGRLVRNATAMWGSGVSQSSVPQSHPLYRCSRRRVSAPMRMILLHRARTNRVRALNYPY